MCTYHGRGLWYSYVFIGIDVPCNRQRVMGTSRYHVQGAKSQVRGTVYHVPGTLALWHVPGTMHQIKARYLVPGIGKPEKAIKEPAANQKKSEGKCRKTTGKPKGEP